VKTGHYGVPPTSPVVSTQARRMAHQGRTFGSGLFSRTKPRVAASQVVIKAGDEFAVAVEEPRWDHLTARTDQLFLGLAPTRMGHFRVDVGPEAILLVLQLLPVGHRALIGERKTHNLFD